MPPTVDHVARAYELLRLERYDLALAEAGQALAADPQAVEAHVCAAWALRDLGRLGDAEDAACAALAAGPQAPAAHNVLACVLWRAARPAAAEDAFKSMLACPTPVPAEFLTNYARFLVVNNHPDQALIVVGQALTVAPTLAIAHEVRGHALARQGRQAEAAAAYRAALEIDPRNFSAHNRLGQIQLAGGQVLDALDSFREALRLKPGDPTAQANLVSALKARHPFYGRVLRLVLRMRNRRVTTALLGVAIALFVGPAILASIAGDGSPLDQAMFQLWSWGIYGLIAFGLLALVWKGIVDPIFNTLLLFDPLGRQAIDYKPADAVRAGALALLVVSVLGFLVTTLLLDVENLIAGLFAGLVLPAVIALVLPADRREARRPWRQCIWVGYAGLVLAVAGMITGATLEAEALIIAGGVLFDIGLVIYIAGWLGSQTRGALHAPRRAPLGALGRWEDSAAFRRLAARHGVAGARRRSLLLLAGIVALVLVFYVVGLLIELTAAP